jgi:hypothetical protein
MRNLPTWRREEIDSTLSISRFVGVLGEDFGKPIVNLSRQHIFFLSHYKSYHNPSETCLDLPVFVLISLFLSWNNPLLSHKSIFYHVETFLLEKSSCCNFLMPPHGFPYSSNPISA